MKFRHHRRAATSQQYALIVGLIAVVAILAITAVGGAVQLLLSRTANALGGAGNVTSGGGGGGGGGGGPAASPFLKAVGSSNFEGGYAMAADGSGGYVVAGATNSLGAGGYDGFIMRFAADGSLSWAKTYGTGSNDYFEDITSDGAGGFIAVGYTDIGTFGLFDCWFIRVAGDGTQTLSRIAGGTGTDVIQGVSAVSGGSFGATGYSDSAGAGGFDALTLSFTTAGALNFTRLVGAGSSDTGRAIAIDGSGGYFITGRVFAGAGGGDALLARYNSAGSLLWTRALGGSGAETGRAIAYGGGDFYMAGETQSAGVGASDILITRINNTGSAVWSKAIGGSGTDAAYAMTVTAGGIAMAGLTNSAGLGDFDTPLLQVTDAGALSWARTIGRPGTEYAYGVAAGSGSIGFAASTNSFGAGNDDVFVGQADGNGLISGSVSNLVWSPTLTDIGWTSATWTNTTTSPSWTASNLTVTTTNWTPSVTAAP